MTNQSTEIHRLMKAIDAIRGDAKEMRVQTLQTFLAIALRPGITTAELMSEVSMSQSSCSRNTAALGNVDRHDDPGLDYIEATQDPNESRRKVYHLNPNGQRCIAAALAALEPQEPTQSIKPHMGRIQNWRRHDANGGIGYVIVGRFLDHDRLRGSNNAHTNYVVKHDEKTGEIETRNSRYALVGPENFRDAA